MIKIGWTTDSNLTGWQYIPADHMITIPNRLRGNTPPELEALLPRAAQERRSWSLEDLFNLFHELGHAHHKHGLPKTRHDQILQETQAWQYAESCLRSEFHTRLWAYANKNLKTYQKGG